MRQQSKRRAFPFSTLGALLALGILLRALQTPPPPQAAPILKIPIAFEIGGYRFIQPRLIYSAPHALKLFDFLPDGRRLLLEIGAENTGLPYRIVTLDQDSGEIVEFGQRGDSPLPPTWVESAQAAAYVLKTDAGVELRLAADAATPVTLDTVEVRTASVPNSPALFYLRNDATPGLDSLVAMTTSSRRLQTEQRSTRATTLHYGALHLDPQAKRALSLQKSRIEIADLATGQTNVIEIGDLYKQMPDLCQAAETEAAEPENGQTLFWQDAAWAPDGKQLALVSGCWQKMLQSNELLIALFSDAGVDVQQWRRVSLLTPTIEDLLWAPNSQALILKAGYQLTVNGEMLPNRLWWVDVPSGAAQPFSLITLSAPLSSGDFMAWSATGRQLAWRDAENGEAQIFVSEVW